ncbi:hypothetical protein [Bacillus atrophaeus]|uniref:hypothetical protein n=1 Tax=Bacillus atrophaeus TaxID=1452 RepID=UPI00077A0D32|nr:hypothetical protein [Bacillus atrophaeus]KXZ13266.1 hypothetical protein AXI57_16050 [Bacillus atrophaeus]MED4806326.1 hypothetical protein [Bacillus atrophaeus]UFD97645.1 hypothetical protein [Bacillus atrophaeus]GED04439.1 hypothetical protein BAT02nite_40830 [Bacillus atrophaeus]
MKFWAEFQKWIYNAIRDKDIGRRSNEMKKNGKGERRNNMNKEDLLWTLRLVLITNSFTATITATILFGVFKVILIATGN